MNGKTFVRLGVMAAALFVVNGGHAVESGKQGEIAASVDRAIQPVMQEYDIPGMAVAVTIDGQHFFMNYGVASRETNSPVTEHTLFELGSISKTFNSTLASYAQVLGKISLDDHPSKYMPQLRDSAIDKATLLNLATYTAGGLPLQFPGEVRNEDQMLAFFKRWRPDAEPGTQRHYSNPSIGLFGHITGLAMGGSFEEVLETVLLPRLGLNGSYVHVPDEEMDRYAWGYNKADRPIRVNPGMFDAEAYGVKSSAADMIRFVEANIQPAKLEEALRRAVEGTHVGYFQIGEMVQGLGWEQHPYPVALERLLSGNSRTMSMEANGAIVLTPPRPPVGATLYNKTGSTNGFGAYAAFVPERKIGIVILANRNFPIPDRIKAAYAILETLAAQAE